MKKQLLFFILLGCYLCTTAQQKRIALVIGNAAYTNNRLNNPVNDANLIEKTLKALDFEVIKLTDVNLRQMQNAAIDFAEKIKQYDVALFYYAGHGIQMRGQNYLIPIGATMAKEASAKYEAFNISDISEAFAENRRKVNIMILDACRDNPFRSWMRSSGSRGFKTIPQTAGTIIAFATREGATAADGNGSNGIFTAALVKQLQKPQNITEVFQNTRAEVLKQTNYEQVPQEWNMLTDNFAFLKPRLIAPVSSLKGTLLLNSELTGNLYVDGIFKTYVTANTSNKKIDDLPEGTHFIELKGTETLSEWITIVPNQNNSVSFKATASSTRTESRRSFEPEMIPVAGGTFTMGCKEGRDGECYDDEKPAHPVSVKDFFIGKYEVTNEEFCVFLNEAGNQEEGGNQWINLSGKYENVECGIEKVSGKFRAKSGQEKLPMVYVSWYGAVAYSKWLSKKTGKNYRLPTEAEWEFASRGGNNSRNYLYSGSNNLEEVAWYSSNSGSKTHKVGSKKANELGIFDMSGNVWEWCADHWHDDYKGAPKDGSAWVSGGDSSRRVLRGGSWYDYRSSSLRSAYRFWNVTVIRNLNLGFRLAQD